jgi:hypothetical protein
MVLTVVLVAFAGGMLVLAVAVARTLRPARQGGPAGSRPARGGPIGAGRPAAGGRTGGDSRSATGRAVAQRVDSARNPTSREARSCRVAGNC